MSIRFQPLEKKHALAVLEWRYIPPYDCYNFDARNTRSDLSYLIDPRNAFFAISNSHQALEGFCSFGSDGQVPGGDYEAQALDIGMGMRPDLTGKGRGKIYARAVVTYGTAQYDAKLLRVTIAAFNRRALRVWVQMGFDPIEKFFKTNSETEFVVMLREINN